MVNSLYYVAVFLGTVMFCVGLVMGLQKPFHRLAISAVRQLDTFLNQSISEVEKDKQILRNLSTLVISLLSVLFLLSVLVLIGMLPAYLYITYISPQAADLSSIYFYLAMFLGSFSLLLFRTKGDYSYWSKLFHILILDHYHLGQYLFRREVKKYGRGKQATEKPFVIVTGLARAGTTALLNLLFDEKVFHAIRYANVPLLLAPNTWKKIYNPKRDKQRERAHGDKVLFSERSIEALEEYFFKVFLNDGFVKSDHLMMHEVPADVLEKYYIYQDLFRQSDQTMYLAKNNNFLLRYGSIQQQNQSMKLILIFRNPFDHAQSLLKQHQNFVERQQADEFVLRYMTWLGHYEFGLNAKQFALGNERVLESYDKLELSYWLAVWINYYSYVAQLAEAPNRYLVHYEDLLQQPNALRESLTSKIGVNLSLDPPEPFVPKQKAPQEHTGIDQSLLDKANEVYEVLLSQKLSI